MFNWGRKKKPESPQMKRTYLGGSINGNPLYVEEELSPEEKRETQQWLQGVARGGNE